MHILLTRRRPAQLRLFALVTTAAFAHLLFLPACSSLAEAAEQRIRYFHPDHLGSTALVTDENGNVIERVEYKPFGEVYRREVRDPTPGQLIVGNMAPSVSPYGFTGQRHDSDTGLYFYGSRYYDPQLGRFTQPDPFVQQPGDPQMLNRYSYVRNNPVRYVDPSGHFVFLAALLFVATTAAVTGTIGAAIGVIASAVTGNIHSFSDFAKAAGRGFVAGAAAGATGAMGALILGPAMAGSMLGSMALGAGSGAIGGGVGSVLSGGSFGQGAGIGALTGGVLAGVGHVVGPYIAQTSFGQAVGRVTQPISSRLNNLYYQALAPRYSGIEGFLTKVQLGIHTSLARINTLLQPGALSGPSSRVTIYRGIGRGHTGYDDAVKGIVNPMGGHDSPYFHNMGNTRSDFTSWTTNRAIAEQFAEGDGVVLQLTVNKSRLIFTPDYYSENEVLLQGAVHDARVHSIQKK